MKHLTPSLFSKIHFLTKYSEAKLNSIINLECNHPNQTNHLGKKGKGCAVHQKTAQKMILVVFSLGLRCAVSYTISKIKVVNQFHDWRISEIISYTEFILSMKITLWNYYISLVVTFRLTRQGSYLELVPRWCGKVACCSQVITIGRTLRTCYLPIGIRNVCFHLHCFYSLYEANPSQGMPPQVGCAD